MLNDREIKANEHSISMMEDFGRFTPAQNPESDTEITDDSFDEAGEEETGIRTPAL